MTGRKIVTLYAVNRVAHRGGMSVQPWRWQKLRSKSRVNKINAYLARRYSTSLCFRAVTISLGKNV